MADSLAQWFYSAPAKVEPDAGSKGRALIAKGDYAGATEAFLEQAKQMPDGSPARGGGHAPGQGKIERPGARGRHRQGCVEASDWPEDDAAYFLFRLVELHDDDLQDPETAAAYLQEVINRYPGTRHAANAAHKLRERGIEPVIPELQS